MRIQLLSDIHLEFGPMDLPKTDADVVVAAGDIGLHNTAVSWLLAFNKPVIYIAGNHEMWGGDLLQRLELFRGACKGTNIHFLERNQVTLNDVTFYGATLWSDFASSDPVIMGYAGQVMNDFAYISLNGAVLEPEWLARYNLESLQWLKKAVSRKTNNKQVIVTHHAPSLKSWGFNADDPIRYAYCNQLDDLIRKWRPSLWIHGHVHCHSDYHILDTRVLCNPRGYQPHKLVDAFEPNRVVEI